MSWLSKKFKKLKKGVKKAPAKLLSGKPLVTGVFSGIPVVGKVTDFVEKGSGIATNSLNWLGSKKPSWADDVQRLNARADQVAAAYFTLGVPLFDAFGQSAKLDNLAAAFSGTDAPGTIDSFGRNSNDTWNYRDDGNAGGSFGAPAGRDDGAAMLVLLAVAGAIVLVTARR